MSDYGVDRLLGELAADLRTEFASASRAPGLHPEARHAQELRPLSIPSGLATASCRRLLKIVIEPIFEADFLAVLLRLPPEGSAHDALQVLLMRRGGAGAGW